VSLENEKVASYEALSYTWGSREAPSTISLNNYPAQVTSNLYDALRYLRDKEKPRVLWVDALCINQEDMEERSAQILFMEKIYATVCRVIVWLGTIQDDQDMDLIAIAGQHGDISSETEAAAANLIFERQWWYRSWTIQEFIHSKERIFVCGSIIMSWEVIRSLLDTILGAMPNDLSHRHGQLAGFLRCMDDPDSRTLKLLMLDFGHCEATDPRDKIYAFISLSKDMHSIIPDYSAPVDRVYTDLVKKYVERERNLGIVCTHHRGYTSAELPSWVPDWSICRSLKHCWTVSALGQSVFSAGFPNTKIGRGNPHQTEHISFIGTQTLHVRCIPVGHINDASPSIDPSSFETDKTQWARELGSCKPQDINLGRYLNGESKLIAFYRTITADGSEVRRYPQDWAHWAKKETVIGNILSDHIPSPEIWNKGVIVSLRRATYSSRFARLSSGHFSLVPNASRIRDEVFILLGGSTPMVLRRNLASDAPCETLPTYRMIGPCYVHGVMDGEAATRPSEKIQIV
jgi:hypothetical protein